MRNFWIHSTHLNGTPTSVNRVLTFSNDISLGEFSSSQATYRFIGLDHYLWSPQRAKIHNLITSMVPKDLLHEGMFVTEFDNRRAY